MPLDKSFITTLLNDLSLHTGQYYPDLILCHFSQSYTSRPSKALWKQPWLSLLLLSQSLCVASRLLKGSGQNWQKAILLANINGKQSQFSRSTILADNWNFKLFSLSPLSPSCILHFPGAIHCLRLTPLNHHTLLLTFFFPFFFHNCSWKLPVSPATDQFSSQPHLFSIN